MSEQKKDGWDKLKALSVVITSILVPIVIAVIGNEYTSALKNSENRVKYTELAIKILTSKPSDSSKNIRTWAIDILNTYSGVPVDANAKEELLNSPLYDWSQMGAYTIPDVKPGERAVRFYVSEHYKNGEYVDKNPTYHLSSGTIGYADEDIFEGYASVGIESETIILVGEDLIADFLAIGIKEYDIAGKEIYSNSNHVDIKDGKAYFIYETNTIEIEHPNKVNAANTKSRAAD